MMWLFTLCSFLILGVFENFQFAECISIQLQSKYVSIYPKINVSREGICTLEVPTKDLLTPSALTSGPVPAGNSSKPGYSTIEICCSGWTQKPHSYFQCQPVCENDCENGNCTAPNVCSCNLGYIKNRNGTCIPTCPLGCLNGVCNNRGRCSCNAGFVPDLPNELSCSPICHEGCGQGGYCVGANVCKCHPGFTLNPSTNKCEHSCKGGCGEGGSCTGPNLCSCKAGYVLAGSICQPHCPKGCINGQCAGPDKCICEPQWILNKDGNVCQPHCENACLNADCTAPNTCTCKKGYIKDSQHTLNNKCVAHCPDGCPNGSCSAPNFCICNPGFIKQSKSSHICIKN